MSKEVFIMISSYKFTQLNRKLYSLKMVGMATTDWLPLRGSTLRWTPLEAVSSWGESCWESHRMPLMIETSTAASEQGAPLLRGSTPPYELIPRFRDGLIEGSKGGGVLPPPRPPIVVYISWSSAEYAPLRASLHHCWDEKGGCESKGAETVRVLFLLVDKEWKRDLQRSQSDEKKEHKLITYW